jgi:CspA family cold shock protein
MDEEREFGVIKTFDAFKGFGFIRRQRGKDVFVFYPDIEEDDRLLAEGDSVSFRVEKAPKGPRAKEVRKEGEHT